MDHGFHDPGKVWTTDSIIRETRRLVAKRKAEGCIAVEMELAGVQAVCDYYGLELYDFLESGDVLEASGYEVEGLKSANHDFGKFVYCVGSGIADLGKINRLSSSVVETAA